MTITQKCTIKMEKRIEFLFSQFEISKICINFHERSIAKLEGMIKKNGYTFFWSVYFSTPLFELIRTFNFISSSNPSLSSLFFKKNYIFNKSHTHIKNE